MKNTVNDWVSENCSTSGVGGLILTGAADASQTRLRDAINAGAVYYSVLDGTNREAGLGTFDGSATISRSTIHSTLVNGVFDDTSPSPISLSGSAIVSVTYNADAYIQMVADLAALNNTVTDIDGRVTSLETTSTDHETRITQNETDILANGTQISINTTDIATVSSDLAVLDLDVSFREVSITAMEEGGALTQNGPTTINISAGRGEIIDAYSDTENQTTEDVTWADLTFDLLTNAGMPVVTGYGQTEIGIITGGVVKAFPNGVSSAQRRSTIVLGLVEYTDQVIEKVTYAPIVSNQIGNTFMDWIEFTPSETKLDGMVIGETTANLSFWRGSGRLFYVGLNYANNKADQNIFPVGAIGDETTPITFTPLLYNNGTTIQQPDTTVFDNDQYEEAGGGTLGPITNIKAVIHYVFQTLGGHFFVVYAQAEYGDYVTATGNLQADFAAMKFPAETNHMVYLGQAVVLHGATTWDKISAGLYPAGGGSSSSSSSGGGASAAIDVSYTDTYTLGANVQVAIDSLAALKLSTNQHDAMNAAAAPTGTNPIATIADVDAVTGVTDHTALTNIGVKTHVEIDAHIADIDNPHGVDAIDVELGNADNTSDADKPVSLATQGEHDNKADINKNLRGVLSGGILYITTDGSTPGP